jgi:hypothetical protein
MDTMPARVFVVASIVLAGTIAGCGPANTRSSVEPNTSSAMVATAPAAQEATASSEPGPGSDTADRKARSSSEGPIHTPESGSAERTAILDAVRRFHNTQDKYVVHEMLVQGDWALCTVSPESAQESVVSYLAVRREGGQWVDVAASDSGETKDWKAGYRDSWIEFGVPSTLVAAYQFKTP